MSDYAEALAGCFPTDAALHHTYAPERPAHLPAVATAAPQIVLPAPAPVVYQPVPLPTPAPRFDVPSLRLASAGLCATGVGGGVYLGGLGVHEAGPYLPWLAGSVAAVAALVAALKRQPAPVAPPAPATVVSISGGKNRIGRIG